MSDIKMDKRAGRRGLRAIGSIVLITLSLVLFEGYSVAQAQIQRSFLNLGFEEVVPPFTNTGSCYAYTPENRVPGWNTTNPYAPVQGGCTPNAAGPTDEGIIEIWRNNFNSIPARAGDQHAELNASAASRLSQSVCLVNGESVSWQFSHTGRSSTTVQDVMEFRVENTPIIRAGTTRDGTGGVVSTGLGTATSTGATNGWRDYRGSFNWSGTSGIKDIGFEAISSAGGNTSAGNMLDQIQVTLTPFVEFGSSTTTAPENSSTATVLPRIRVSGNVTAAFTVQVQVTGGTATLGSDYTTPTGTNTFNVTVPVGNYDGTTTIPVPITITNDTSPENSETIIMQLGSNPTSYTISGTQSCGGTPVSTSTHTITDDDVELSVAKAQRQGTSAAFSSAALTIPPSQTIQYQIQVSNNGAGTVTGATFSDPVPSNVSGLSVVSATGGGGATACSASFSSNTLNGTFSGPLNATCTVIVQGTTATNGTFNNTATVTAPTGFTDTTPANNTSTVSTTVQPLTPPPCSTTFAGGLSAPYNIYPLNSDGTAGSALFAATFAGSPTTASTAAFARDPSTSRLYYIESTTTSTSRVGYYDFTTGQTVAAGTITKDSADTSGNFTRFGFNANGVGYASISSTNAVYRITTNPFSATRIGTITGLPTGLSGDFAITAANRAWLSANGDVYRVNLNDSSLPAVQVVNTNNADVNGVAFTSEGNLLVSDTTTSREVNLATLAFGAPRTMTGQPNTSRDLANCIVPTLEPNLSVVKSVSPSGSVSPGTVLTYTITTTNTGNAVSVRTTFQDAIPANTTYVPGSTTLNGASVTDATGGVMPYVTAGPIKSPDTTISSQPIVYGSGIVATTNPAVVTFQVRINNPFPSTATSVTNQGFVEYDSGSSETRINVPSAPAGGGTGGTPTTVGNRDFGDAPDTATGTATGNYQTTAADGGPSHTIVSGLRLGSVVADADDGTLQNAAATADDTNGTDDEDGVASFPAISTLAAQVITVPVNVTNTTGNVATLVGYLDFNKDGDFLDTGEQSASVSVAANATLANVVFTSPTGLTPGTTYARFRIGSTATEVTSSVGAASSGEVEDYLVTIGSPDLTIAKTHTGNFIRGSSGTYTLSVGNSSSANTSTSGTITVTDTLPAGMTVNGGASGSVTPGGTNGANWACTSNAASPQVVTCTSTTAIAVGGSSVFTLTVNVAANAGTPLVNNVAVSGGGEATANNGNNTASDSTVTVAPTDLTLSKSHTGNFTVGQAGAYSLTVNNVGGVASSGTITVTDTLPAGLSYTSVSGSGWSCSASGQTVTCTSTASIAAGGSSTFTLNVSVGTGTVAGTNSITNTATVSGGGDATTTNNSANNGNGDPTTVFSPNLTIAKSHTPSTFVRGSTGTYSITVTNAAGATAPTSGPLTVTDTLPPGLTFVAGSASPAAWSCSATGQTVTCTNTTTTLAAGSSSTFSFGVNVATSTADSVTNTVTVSGGNEATSLNGNNTATDPTPTAGTPDLTLTKTHSGTFTRGTTGIYTLTVSNSGNLATSGTITVTDTLPANFTVNGGAAGSVTIGGANGANWTCTSNAASPQVVTCTSTTPIAVGGSSVFTLPVNVGLSAAASVVNTATVSGGGEAAVNNGNNSASDTTSTIGAADLSLSKSHTGSFTVGSTGTYSFVVNNSGESATSGTITVSDTLPDGLSFVSGSASAGWSCSASGQNVTCTSSAVIASGGSSTFSFSVNVGVGTALPSVTNTATVSGGGDINTANNSANNGNGDPTTILSPNLTITKTHAPSSFVRGSTGSYTITVGNSGTAPTSGTTTVTDTLPTGLTVPAGLVTLTGANATNWTCSASGQTLTCTSTTAIAVNGNSVFTFAVNVGSAAASSVANVASVTNPNEATVNTGNNSVTDTTPTVGPPDLTVTKSHTPSSFTVGSTGTYTLVVSNGGGSATTSNVTVTDTLPAGLTYAGGVIGTGWSCSASGQTVTCTGTSTIASTAGSNTSTLSFNVNVGVGTALPSVTNTASVVGGGDTTSANSNSDATPILSSNLTVSKTHTPATFVRGSTGTYTITVSNGGTAATSGTTTVTDTLPAGLTVNGGAAGTVTPGGTNGAAWSCTSNAASQQVVTCTSTTPIAAPGSSVFSLSVTVGATTALPSVTNNVAVGNPNEATVNTGNNTASDVTPTATPTDLTMSKSSSGTFVKGSTGTYTLTVSNSGGTASSGTITVSDTLPTGLSYNAASGSGWSCSASGQVVTCTTTASVAAAGGSAPPITLTVNVLGTAPASVDNTATVSGGGDANPGNNSGSTTTAVTAIDLTLNKSHTGDFTVGSTGTYALSVANDGTAPSSGTITVTDALPVGLTVNGGASGTVTLAGTNAAAWSCTSNAASPQVITCTSTTAISANSSSLFGFSVAVGLNTAVGTDSVTNSAAVSGGGDSNTANNTDTDPTTILSPNLTIAKSHTPTTFIRGSTGTYTITVGNSGTAPTSGPITVTDTLPAGLTYANGVSGAGWSCSAVGQIVTCTSSTAIPVDGSSAFTFTVNVSPTAGATLQNQATVGGGGEATANTGNNSVTDDTATLDPRGDLTPFPCTPSLYQVYGTSGQLATLDLNAGTFDNAPNNVGYVVNAVGYRPSDGLTYGVRNDSDGRHLIALGADGSAVDLGIVSGLPQGQTFNNGDLGPNDYLYVKSQTGSTVYAINVDTRTVVSSYALSQSFASNDVAYDSTTGRFYSVTAASTGQLVYFTLSGGSANVTVVGSTGVNTSSSYVGAMYVDANGAVVGVRNNGEVYRFALSGANAGKAIRTGTVPVNVVVNNDGFNCKSAVFAFAKDFGDAPVSYGSAAQTRDPGTLYITSVDAFGSAPDADPTNRASAAADGDDTTGSDDEETTPGNLTVGNPNYSLSIRVSNTTGQDAYLCGYLDAGLSANGFNGTFNTPSERVCAVVPSGAGLQTVSLAWTGLEVDPGETQTFLRLILATEQSEAQTASGTGLSIGEVEDYLVPVGSAADLVTTKTVNNAATTEGGTVIFTITVTNNGPSPATNVSLTDTWPAGLTLTTANPSQGSYAPASGLWTVGTVNSGSSATLILSGTVNAGQGGNTLTNTTTAADGDQPDPTTNGDDLTESVTVANNPELTLVKTGTVDDGGDGVVNVGDTINYAFTVTNSGNVTLTNITLSDALPEVELDGDPIPSLAPGASNSTNFTGTYTLTQDDIDVGEVENAATVSGSGPQGEDVLGTDDVTTPITQKPSFTTDKTVDQATIASPGTLTYTITLTNTGNVSLTGIEPTDTMPDGDVITLTNPDESLEEGEDGVLEVGEVWTYTTTYEVTQEDIEAGQNLVNTASVTTAQTPSPQDIAVTTISQNYSLSVDKVVDKLTSNTVDDILTYTITLRNTGNVPLTNISVVDTLPDASEATLTFTGGDVDSNEVLDLDEEWTYTTTYTVTQDDLDAGNNLVNEVLATADNVTVPVTDDATTVLDQEPGILVDKDVDRDSISSPGPLNYTITVTNTGNISFTTVNAVDTLPDGSLVTLTDPEESFDLGVVGVLEPGETWTYTTSYAVSQAELNAGEPLTNNVEVTATDGADNDVESDSVTTTPARNPQLVVVKTVDKTSISAPGTLNYLIRLRNAGNVSLTNVVISDTLPDGSPATLGPRTGDNGVPNEIDVGETWAYTATYEATQDDIDAGDDLVNDVTVTTADDPVGQDASATTTVSRTPSLTLTKTGTVNAGADGIVGVGDTITYAFTVTNTGNVTLTNLTITDPNATVSGGTLASLPVGDADSTTFTATHTLTQEDIDAGSVTNQATVSADNPAGGPDITDLSDDPNNPTDADPEGDGEPDDSTVTTFARSADLSLTKTGPSGVVVGQTVTYTLTITNNGPSAAGGSSFSDTVPANITGVGATCGTAAGGSSGCSVSVSGNTVTGTIATLPSGASQVITVTGTASTPGSFTNSATVTPPEAVNDPDLTDNTGSQATAVAAPDLTLEKAASSAFVRGGIGTYTLSVSNEGDSATSGTVTVTDTLPTGLTYNAATGTGWTCGASGQTVTCTTTTAIPAGGTAPVITLTVNVAGTAPADITNTAEVSGGGEVDTNNNSSTIDTQTVDAGSLAITKTVRNVTANTSAGVSNQGEPDEVLEYCIAYSNPGQSQVTNVVITDTIPTTTTPLTTVADYGAQAIRWRVTDPTASTTNLSADTDSDAGELGALLTVRVGTIPALGAGDVCFQAQIK